MIGYGKGKIILKFPPIFRLIEENQELEIQNQMKTKPFLFSFDVLNFPALSEEMREFKNNFSFSVPYHIQPCLQSDRDEFLSGPITYSKSLIEMFRLIQIQNGA